MSKDIIQHLFPFYQKMKSLEDVLAFLLKENERMGRNEYSFRIAMMLAKAGKKEESKKYFRESIGMKDAIERTAASFGIDL
jgi:2-phosphoglycerate kinase